MGLDMYLYKRTYILSGEWIKEERRQEVSVSMGGNPDPKIKPKIIFGLKPILIKLSFLLFLI